ncbi:MAG: regulator of sigma D, partial [Gammaproteobacteria bacterium]
REYYALMLRGTRLALLFNDHHSVDCKDDIKASRFILEFSELGMMLAQRFEAEDHLLKI